MAKEDVWVHSSCDMCMGHCGILVDRVDGVVVKIEGDPNCPSNWGTICSKGTAGIMHLYDPNRLKTPLRRTNPEKGIGVDPKWVPISWEEALDILGEKLSKVRKEDPRKLVISTFDQRAYADIVYPWAVTFGTPNVHWIGYFCGQYLHAPMYLTSGAWQCDFDPDYCNYLILLGNQTGHGAGFNPNITIQLTAAARRRGLKVVAVDPVCQSAGSKGEWVPIRPGTDAAFVLALINVLLNELGIYDTKFIKKYTNGTYLAKPDGYYMRQNGKPLIWDTEENKAKPYDAKIEDCALEGNYLIDGVECKPAFQLLKEHVKKYTPEMAAEITTVPAATIRRLAEEFGREARIGSTITIDGVELPYRPVAVNINRGAGAHRHGVAACLATQILNMVVGAFYSVGSVRGNNLIGPSWSWAPGEFEGMVTPPRGIGGGRGTDYYHFELRPPDSLGLEPLFPISSNRAPLYLACSLDPEKYKLPYKPEILITCRRNLMLSGVNHDITAEVLKKYKFIVWFGTCLDEVAEFADLALPETTHLEKLEILPNLPGWGVSQASGYFYWGIRQPVVPPQFEARNWHEVLLDIAERLGFLREFYELFNRHHLKEPYILDPTQKYTLEEIYDRRLKSLFGEEKGLEWFKRNGYYNVKRPVDEQYPLPWLKVRFPLYYENIKLAGEKVRELTQKMGLDWWDTSDYEALPDYKPCHEHEARDFDLYAVNFRLPTHYDSWSAENPWLCELAELNPYAQKIQINTKTAQQKGIKDNDEIWVESVAGRVKGKAKVTECIHPEVVGISGHFGAWAKGKPVARGKGTNVGHLLPYGPEHIDPISSGVDACVKVKVCKA